LYQFTRLAYGVSSAPALFQTFMDTLLQGIPKTVAYLDHVLVPGLVLSVLQMLKKSKVVLILIMSVFNLQGASGSNQVSNI